MKHKAKTGDLFDIPRNEPEWKREWKDMPEFIQEDLTSYRKIVVHFRNEEDVRKFSELLGQRITQKQPSLWFPEMPPRRYAHLRYVNDNE